MGALWCAACGDPKSESKLGSEQSSPGTTPAAQPTIDPYREFPLHGLITGTVVTVRKAADPTAIPLGWLRRGEIVRLKASSEKSATCKSGWYPLHPQGFVCAGEGI